jgi:alcohol dehydrogenase (cytochrome c)
MRITLLLGILALVPAPAFPQSTEGKQSFESRCARCHGADGNGGEMGPSITRRLPPLDNAQLDKLIRDGIPTRGMPPAVLGDVEARALVGFLRTIERRESDEPIVRKTIQTVDNRTIAGRVLGEGFDDLQLRTDDGRVHLLRRSGDRYRGVTSSADWPTYNGEPGGNRYTTL